ncbi:MAG: sulfatase-like hydrolase/transferase [Sandaracinaceae bacterium]|nr:sulfatase-like hydrolase/transferase [Myxococcales bacterium]MCB9662315.1 sulfatase-like hydrolase/transferase [Sandaracinaceae bacterium]
MTASEPPRGPTWAPRVLLAGVLVSALDIGLAVATPTWSLFLGQAERHTFVALALTAGVGGAAACYALGHALARVAPDAEGRARLLCVIVFALATVVLYLLTSGRRVHDSPLRVPLVSLVAAIPAFTVLKLGARFDARARAGGSATLALGVLALALAAGVADAFLLRRLYPVFHGTLAALVLVFVSVATWLAPLRDRRSSPRLLAVLVGVALLGLPMAVWRALSAPNVAFVVAEYTGVSGRTLQLAERLLTFANTRGDATDDLTGPRQGDAASEMDAPDLRTGLRLTSRNVLLITVDALRADRLRSPRHATPQLDALADESAVFERAYTPTPHTSYALSSLLTGKYLRPVLDLPGAPSTHVALPELLRRYGMRTAAFYPPAIFFVDAHRFEALREARFGFEYQKEMFAPAHRRVRQLREYLQSLEQEGGGERDVFAWVHLFEPHEPYDPDPRFARGDSAEERYDAEVAAADDAIGDLVRVFRRYRPGATVIVTADHGEEFGDHGGLYHGSTLYEEQVRVPLLWSTPELVHPFESHAPVELVDIATTILAALGIPRDARMRGDDLGPLLVHQEGGPRYAFAEVGDARMVTDGLYKAICATESTACQLYDLTRDPGERRNVAHSHPEVLARLRGALSGFVASIPDVEAMAMAGSQAWPEALARAELGDASVAPELMPLLGDTRATVRAGTARLLGRLRHLPALHTLIRIRDQDDDQAVRDEAALASLALGDEGSSGLVRALVSRPDTSLELRRRGALVLAARGDRAGASVLDAWAADASAEEGERRSAVLALGALRAAASLDTLVTLLSDVRLGPAAATALGMLGDRRAVGPLRRKLRDERYLPARAAEARALTELGDRAVIPLLWRYLGMEQPVPGGVALLGQLGVLRRPSGRGLVLGDAPGARVGEWVCAEEGCEPRTDARVVLPSSGAPRGAVRVVCAVRSEREAVLTLLDVRREVQAGSSQVTVDATGPLEVLSFAPAVGVTVDACVVAPAQRELPAPPPEPTPATPRP